jgi:hypothetical protein
MTDFKPSRVPAGLSPAGLSPAGLSPAGLSEAPGAKRLEMTGRAKKIATTVYITEEQQNLLKELNRRTRVPIAEFIREGIDLVLEKHASMLPGQLGFLNESSQLNQIR